MQPVEQLVDYGPFKEYADLTVQKRAIEESLEAVKLRLVELEAQVLEQMAIADTKRIHLGEHTVYLQRQVWARPTNGDAERTAAALKAAGIEELVSETVNIHRLSAWVRELEKNGEELPGDLTDYIAVEDRFRALVRKAPS